MVRFAWLVLKKSYFFGYILKLAISARSLSPLKPFWCYSLLAVVDKDRELDSAKFIFSEYTSNAQNVIDQFKLKPKGPEKDLVFSRLFTNSL